MRALRLLVFPAVLTLLAVVGFRLIAMAEEQALAQARLREVAQAMVVQWRADFLNEAQLRCQVLERGGVVTERLHGRLWLINADSGSQRGQVILSRPARDQGSYAPELLRVASARPRVSSVEGSDMLMAGCSVNLPDGRRALIYAKPIDELLSPFQGRLAYIPSGESAPGDPLQELADGQGSLVWKSEEQDVFWPWFLALAIAGLFPLLLLRRTPSVPSDDIASATTMLAAQDFDREVARKIAATLSDASLPSFERLAGELERAQSRVARRERRDAWREVAQRIAHELKNPLQPIQMEMETLRKLHASDKERFAEEFDGAARVVLEEVGRLNRMVSEFSRFARIAATNKTSVRVEDLATDVLRLFPEVRVAGKAGELWADADQLKALLMNLLQNARDSVTERHKTFPPGKIELSLRRDASGLHLAVIDNGKGVALAERQKVFEPYVTGKSGGTGLGLAIVERIAVDHGGTVEVRDGLDGGAAFVCWLPNRKSD